MVHDMDMCMGVSVYTCVQSSQYTYTVPYIHKQCVLGTCENPYSLRILHVSIIIWVWVYYTDETTQTHMRNTYTITHYAIKSKVCLSWVHVKTFYSFKFQHVQGMGIYLHWARLHIHTSYNYICHGVS